MEDTAGSDVIGKDLLEILYLPGNSPKDQEQIEVNPNPEVNGVEATQPLIRSSTDAVYSGMHHGKRNSQPLQSTANEC